MATNTKSNQQILKVVHKGRQALVVRDRKLFPGLVMEYIPGIFNPEQCERNEAYLRSLEYVDAVLIDRTMESTESYAWYSDRGDFVYSLVNEQINAFQPLAWSLRLKSMRTSIHDRVNRVNQDEGKRRKWIMGNSSLITWYKGSTSKTLRRPAFPDPWLGGLPRIYYVYFGKSRWIRIRPRSSSAEFHRAMCPKEKGEGAASGHIDILLQPGSVLLVEGEESFVHWRHEICPLRNLPAGSDPRKWWTFEVALHDVKPILINDQYSKIPALREMDGLQMERRETPKHTLARMAQEDEERMNDEEEGEKKKKKRKLVESE